MVLLEKNAISSELPGLRYRSSSGASRSICNLQSSSKILGSPACNDVAPPESGFHPASGNLPDGTTPRNPTQEFREISEVDEINLAICASIHCRIHPRLLLFGNLVEWETAADWSAPVRQCFGGEFMHRVHKMHKRITR